MFVGASLATIRSSACIAGLLVCPSKKRLSSDRGVTLVKDAICMQSEILRSFKGDEFMWERAMRMPPGTLTRVHEANPFELLVLSRDQVRQVFLLIER